MRTVDVLSTFENIPRLVMICIGFAPMTEKRTGKWDGFQT